MIFHYFEGVINHHEKQDALYKLAYIFSKCIGSIGVEIFLLLSGMGLYFSYTKNKDIGAFYKKRYTRVLIPYLMYGAVIWFISDIIMLGKDFSRYLFDLSLFSFWQGGNKRLWFIAAIVVFYALFPLFYEVVTSKRYRLYTFLLIAFFVLALYVSFLNKPKNFGINEIAATRLPIFIFGIYAGRLAYEKKPVKAWHIALLSVIFIIKVLTAIMAVKGRFSTLPPELKGINKWFSDTIGNRLSSSVFSLGFIFMIILILALIRQKWFEKFLIKTGSISLELYMCHVTIRGIVTSDKTFDMCDPVVYSIAMAASVVLAIVLHIASGAVINMINNDKRKEGEANA